MQKEMQMALPARLNLIEPIKPMERRKLKLVGGENMSLGHVGSIDTEQEIDKVSDEESKDIGKAVVQSCSWLNDLCDELMPGLRFDTSKLENLLASQHISDAWKETCSPVKKGVYKGSFVKEQALTIFNVLFAYFNEPDRDIVILGPCQGAKTLVFAVCFLLLPILERLINRRIAIPFITTPSYKNLQLSTLQEVELVSKLYADIDVVYETTGERIHFNYVKEQILSKLGTGEKNWDNVVLCRHRRQLNEFVESIAKEQQCVAINFIDELHHGSKKGSVIDDYEKYLKNTHPGLPLRRIGITATPSETWGIDRWQIIPMWMAPNYVGITIYNGEQLPTLSGQKPKMPELLAIEDEFPEFAKYLDLKEYESPSYFAKKRGIRSCQPWEQILRLHEKYRNQFAKAVFDIYKAKVTTEHPIFFLRPFAKVINCEDLFKRLEKIAKTEGDNYCLLRFFGNALGPEFGNKRHPKTVKLVLYDHFINKGKFCLVMTANGRSRMGDSYPKETRHYMDLVQNSCCWDSIIQSTVGRSMGFNKQSICYLRRDYRDAINEFIAGGCYDKKKPFGPRTIYQDGHGNPQRRGRPGRCTVLVFPQNGDEVRLKSDQILLRDYDPELHNKLYVMLYKNLNKKGFKRITGTESPGANAEFYKHIFDRQTLDAIGEIVGYHFIDWGTKNANEELVGGELVNVGLRWANSYAEWAGGSTRVDVASKKVRIVAKDIVRPQIVVTMKHPDNPNLYRNIIEAGKIVKNAGEKAPEAKKDRVKQDMKNKTPYAEYAQEIKFGITVASDKIRKSKWWDQLEIIPLFVYLPRDHKIASRCHTRHNVAPSPKSRHCEELVLSLDNQQEEVDKERGKQMEMFMRGIAQKWRKQNEV
jgi:hypothetical protein